MIHNDSPRSQGVESCRGLAGPIVLQKSNVAGLRIFRENTKREAIADSYNLNRVTEVVCEFCLLYTSGTTGAPKGVIVTHAAALGNCKSSAIGALKLSEADSAMAVMPLFHA